MSAGNFGGLSVALDFFTPSNLGEVANVVVPGPPATLSGFSTGFSSGFSGRQD